MNLTKPGADASASGWALSSSDDEPSVLSILLSLRPMLLMSSLFNINLVSMRSRRSFAGCFDVCHLTDSTGCDEPGSIVGNGGYIMCDVDCGFTDLIMIDLGLLLSRDHKNRCEPSSVHQPVHQGVVHGCHEVAAGCLVLRWR